VSLPVQSCGTFCKCQARVGFRKVHHFHEKRAFFNIPALDIDTDVDGLMVIGGLTISSSELTITIVAHGIELGIKLSDDMELAIRAEECTIAFFGKIEIGDMYGNLKWAEFETTFHQLAKNTLATDGDAAMTPDPPQLRATTLNMASEMMGGDAMKDSSAKSSFEYLTRLSFADELTGKEYEETLAWIQETSAIHQSGEYVKRVAQNSRTGGKVVDGIDEKELRAGICSQRQDTLTINQVHHTPEFVAALYPAYPAQTANASPSFTRHIELLPPSISPINDRSRLWQKGKAHFRGIGLRA
jgi:hypothetical protein